MKNNKQRLVKWVESMGFDKDQSIGIVDGIIKKIIPSCNKFKITPERVIAIASRQSNCTTLDQLKKNINFVFKREMNRARDKALLNKENKAQWNKEIETQTPVTKETLSKFRSLIKEKYPLKQFNENIEERLTKN